MKTACEKLLNGRVYEKFFKITAKLTTDKARIDAGFTTKTSNFLGINFEETINPIKNEKGLCSINEIIEKIKKCIIASEKQKNISDDFSMVPMFIIFRDNSNIFSYRTEVFNYLYDDKTTLQDFIKTVPNMSIVLFEINDEGHQISWEVNADNQLCMSRISTKILHAGWMPGKDHTFKHFITHNNPCKSIIANV